MSDILTPVFWLASAGLTLAMTASVALVRLETARSRTATRIDRALGKAPSRPSETDDRPSGALAHLGGRLRRLMLMAGERMAAITGGEARETSAELASAGYRGRDALLVFAFLKTVLPVAALAFGGLWLALDTPEGIKAVIRGAMVLATALALSKGVDIWIDQRRRARLARIRIAFPDMLELLVISSEAGLGPQPALSRVGREMAATQPELAQDVLQMVSEMGMTNDRRGAYARLANRIPLPEVGVFTQTLDQSDRYGTPFARAMRTLIREQRANRMMAVEEKAARLPVLMTLPLIFCIMPAVFVVLLGPAVLSVFDNIIAGG